jgi:hypothetical protein
MIAKTAYTDKVLQRLFKKGSSFARKSAIIQEQMQSESLEFFTIPWTPQPA